MIETAAIEIMDVTGIEFKTIYVGLESQVDINNLEAISTSRSDFKSFYL